MEDKYTVKSVLSVAAKQCYAIGSANNHSAITVQRDEQTTVAGNNSAKNGISQFENLSDSAIESYCEYDSKISIA